MKFRNCTLLYLIPLLFLVANAFGQKYVDIAKIYYGNTVQNNFENSDSSTRIKDLGFDITFPIVVNSSKAVLTGLIYERNETKLFEAGPVETFSVTGLRVGLSKKHSDKWSGTYLLVPKLASDFENITRKDFQIVAILLMKYTKR